MSKRVIDDIIHLNSEMNCPSGQEVIISAGLPYNLLAFRPRKFKFDNPTYWKILDFLIGNNSQLERSDGFNAELFHEFIIKQGCDTIQTRMYYSMKVIYLGNSESVFNCDITGEGIRS